MLHGVVREDSLDYNYLNAAGGTALAPALRKLTALQTLKYVCGWGVMWR
jgi:hypothetical protein